MVLGVAPVELLGEVDADLGGGGDVDARLGAVDSRLELALSAVDAPIGVERCRLLAEIPDVAGPILRGPRRTEPAG